MTASLERCARASVMASSASATRPGWRRRGGDGLRLRLGVVDDGLQRRRELVAEAVDGLGDEAGLKLLTTL
jgi:hypothetical protein